MSDRARAKSENDGIENTLWHVLRTLLFRCVCERVFSVIILLLLLLLHSYNSSVNVLWEYTTAARFWTLCNSTRLYYTVFCSILPSFVLTQYNVQYFCCCRHRRCYHYLLSLQCVPFAFTYNICPSIIFSSLIFLLILFCFAFCSIRFIEKQTHSRFASFLCIVKWDRERDSALLT